MGALFFDIDDTLLSGITKKVPESALEGIRKVKENGHKVLINTGRTICRWIFMWMRNLSDL